MTKEKLDKIEAREYLNELLFVPRIIYCSSIILEKTFFNLMEQQRSQH